MLNNSWHLHRRKLPICVSFQYTPISLNEIISAFWWEIVYDKPNYLTVQIGNQEHIILEPACLECINHSCTPNSFFDTEKKLLICISPIKTGEEFTFFYPSAEWEMEQTFDCHCKKLNCIGRVKGAKFLDKKILEKYRLTSLIAQKLLEKKI